MLSGVEHGLYRTTNNIRAPTIRRLLCTAVVISMFRN